MDKFLHRRTACWLRVGNWEGGGWACCTLFPSNLF